MELQPKVLLLGHPKQCNSKYVLPSLGFVELGLGLMQAALPADLEYFLKVPCDSVITINNPNMYVHCR